jgi:hypothetical protein
MFDINPMFEIFLELSESTIEIKDIAEIQFDKTYYLWIRDEGTGVRSRKNQLCA